MKFLSKAGAAIAHARGKKFMDIVRSGGKRGGWETSVVYRIPCKDCESVYSGESALGMEKRLYEHRRYLHHHRTTNSLVVHAEEHGHLPIWDAARILHAGLNRRMRRTLEAAHITPGKKATNHRKGSVNLVNAMVRLILRRPIKPSKGTNHRAQGRWWPSG